MNQENMPNNMPNNQVPMGGNPNNNGMVPPSVPTQTGENTVTQQNNIPNNNSVPATSAAPVSNNQVADNGNKDEVSEVTKILSSSFESKEKVNLLTPEQKEELMKKREAAMREKENYQPQPVSGFQKFFMAFFLIGMIVIVFFLPDINAYIVKLQGEEDEVNNSSITTGVLKCVKSTADSNYNFDYTFDFEFTDSKLKKLSYYEVIKGSYVSDSEDLENRLTNCKLLKSTISSQNGIRVGCSLSGGTLTIEQVFDYSKINVDGVSAAYTEAGGTYPGEFSFDADIEAIERNMKASDYSCERYR